MVGQDQDDPAPCTLARPLLMSLPPPHRMPRTSHTHALAPARPTLEPGIARLIVSASAMTCDLEIGDRGRNQVSHRVASTNRHVIHTDAEKRVPRGLCGAALSQVRREKPSQKLHKKLYLVLMHISAPGRCELVITSDFKHSDKHKH